MKENKSQKYYGSGCLTDLIEGAKKKHSAFSKASNGKIYFNFELWINEEPDTYKNHVSIKLNSKEGMHQEDDAKTKRYIGNAKKAENKEAEIEDSDLPNGDELQFD